MTRASFELGNATATEFAILVNDLEQIVASGFHNGGPRGNAHLVVMNKKTGLAIWTKSRTAGLFTDVPDSQTLYLQCK